MSPERWRQVKAIFHHAVECDAAERTQFIRDACGSDQELLSEVESLLAADEKEYSPLDDPLAGTAAMAPPAPQPDPMVGRTVGNYLITGELARGGMGIVYLARHTTLPRDVVIKCIRPAVFSAGAQDELRTRFRQEAYIQSQLDHPHIVRVYEFLTEPEEYFLVLEYVRGQTIRSRLDRDGMIPPEEAGGLAVQALEGLAYAHGFRYVDDAGNNGVGIIHRDVKPANLLIDEHGHLKLTDFGIAKALGLGLGSVTKTGFGPGTASYMSPEQIRNQQVDARSDLYSMGVTLYEMMTGRLPFRTEARSEYEMFKAQIETDPLPIRSLNPSIPPDLADVVTRALNKDPAERWQTATEFREALIACQQGRPIVMRSAAPPPEREPVSDGTRRRYVLGAAVLALLLAAASLYWLGLPIKHPQPPLEAPSIAVLPFVDMSPEKNQEYFSDGLAEELLNELAQTPGLRVAGRTSSFQFKGKNEDLRSIGKQLNVTTILEGSVRRQGNRARITTQLIKTADGFHIWSATYEREMNDIFAVQEEIARAVIGALKVTLLGKSPETMKPTNPEAYSAYLEGKHFREQFTEEGLARSVGYFEQAIDLDPGYAPAWVGLAISRIGQANLAYIPPQEGYRRAREALRKALQLNPNLADAHEAMGEIQMLHDWDWAAADASYQRAFELSPGSPGVMRALGSLARLLGRSDESVQLYRCAIEIDPLVGYRNLALNLYYAGRQDEARAAIEKALDLTPNMVFAHCLLARIYLAQSNPRQALEEVKKEKDPFWRTFGFALVYPALGRRKEADAALEQLIEKYRADAPYSIAGVYAQRGEADLAFQWLERAYTTRDSGLTEMKSDPLLKKLVHDPRYAAMLRKMRLPV